MSIDAIIIADSGVDSVSGSNPLRLKLDGRIADIQTSMNYLNNKGKVVTPINGDYVSSWSSALMLNGISLYNYLKNNNFNVELINRYYDEKEAFCKLLKKGTRVIIISTTFIYKKQDLNDLVNDIRSIAPDVYIIAGGPFVYSSYIILNRNKEDFYNIPAIRDDFLFSGKNEPLVDLYIISPKGENILCEALSRIRSKKSTKDLPNSACLKNSTYSFTERIDELSNNENTYIDWQSLPQKVFRSGVIPMQASIGCNYNCLFCNFVKDRRLKYLKPLDQLINELKIVANLGVRYVWFTDDNFRLGSNDINEISRRIINERINIRWLSFVKANTLSNVDFELLRQSGCLEVQIGIESADIQVLTNMNKRTDPDLYRRIIRGLLQAGINCSCYFIFGFPGETDQSIAKTVDFIKSVESPSLDGIFSWSIYPFLLAPLSPIYEPKNRTKYSLSGYMSNWTHSTMDSGQALKHIKKAFSEIENSGPIYRSDNQDFMYSLSSSQRKDFVICRHKLAKYSLSGSPLEKEKTLDLFSKVLK